MLSFFTGPSLNIFSFPFSGGKAVDILLLKIGRQFDKEEMGRQIGKLEVDKQLGGKFEFCNLVAEENFDELQTFLFSIRTSQKQKSK